MLANNNHVWKCFTDRMTVLLLLGWLLMGCRPHPSTPSSKTVATPQEDTRMGVMDTLGISLRPTRTVYSTQAPFASFILLNLSNEYLEVGEHYSIAYEDKEGVWRQFPMNRVFFAVSYCIPKNGIHTIYNCLDAGDCSLQPGRYRFFYIVTLTRSQKEVLMMAEFRLSDKEEEAQNAPRLRVPPEKSTKGLYYVSPIDSSVAVKDPFISHP